MFGRLLRDPVILAALVGALGVFANLPALTGDFVFDDIPAIVENPLVTGEAPAHAAFTTNFWGGRQGYEHVTTWRPLTTLTFRWNAALSSAPFGFRAVNLFLHGLVSALVCGLVFLWIGRRSAALAAGALFAVLPIHVEAIAGAVNRAELLAAAFYLLGLIAVLRRRPMVGVALFLLALLSKEHAITWPAAVAVLWWHQWLRHRQAPRRHPQPFPVHWMAVALAGLVIAAYLVQRARVLPSLLGGEIPPLDNPLVLHGLGARLLTAAKLYFLYLGQLIAPAQLSCDYTFNAVPVAASLADPDAFAGIIAVLGSVAALVVAARRRPDLAGPLALFAVLYGLASQFVILNTILMADRLMYLPSVAFCALVGVVAAGLYDAPFRPALRVGLATAAALLVTGYGARSAERCQDWRDPVTLFKSSLDGWPGSARAHYNLGRAYRDRGMWAAAKAELLQARLVDPSDADIHTALGNVAAQQGRLKQSLIHFREAFKRAPNRPLTRSNLCRALATLAPPPEAIDHCRAVAKTAPKNALVRTFLGIAYRRNGDLSLARQALLTARRLEPQNPFIRTELSRLAPADGPPRSAPQHE